MTVQNDPPRAACAHPIQQIERIVPHQLYRRDTVAAPVTAMIHDHHIHPHINQSLDDVWIRLIEMKLVAAEIHHRGGGIVAPQPYAARYHAVGVCDRSEEHTLNSSH